MIKIRSAARANTALPPGSCSTCDQPRTRAPRRDEPAVAGALGR
jgi:hypothetical protein